MATDFPEPRSVPDDTPPDREASNDTEPARCASPGCPNHVIKPARGRTPKYCSEHTSARSTATGRRKTAWAEAERVENAFDWALRGLGGGVALIDPFDGRCIANGSKPVAHEIVEILRMPKYKDARELVTKLTAPGDFGPLFMTLVPIVLPILAHHKLLPQFVIPNLSSVPNMDEGRETA